MQRQQQRQQQWQPGDDDDSTEADPEAEEAVSAFPPTRDFNLRLEALVAMTTSVTDENSCVFSSLPLQC